MATRELAVERCQHKLVVFSVSSHDGTNIIWSCPQKIKLVVGGRGRRRKGVESKRDPAWNPWVTSVAGVQFHCGHPTFVASFLCGKRSSLQKNIIHMYMHCSRFGRSYGLQACREIDMRTQE